MIGGVGFFIGAAWLAVGAVVWWVSTSQPYDNTDPPGARSGMGLRTDNLTGCQYLTNPSGGIVARVDGRGRHVGCRIPK